MTLVRAVVAKALRDAAAFNAGVSSAPATVLWTDPERTWEPVIRSLQEAVPILVLGEYDPAAARGPALWLRAVLASPESAELPAHLAERDERNPWVIYLPGVSRGSVIEAAALDDSLAPLAEVAIRSNWCADWGQWVPRLSPCAWGAKARWSIATTRARPGRFLLCQ